MLSKYLNDIFSCMIFKVMRHAKLTIRNISSKLAYHFIDFGLG